MLQQRKHGCSQAKHVPTQFYVRVGTHVYMGVVSQDHPEGACEHVFMQAVSQYHLLSEWVYLFIYKLNPSAIPL